MEAYGAGEELLAEAAALGRRLRQRALGSFGRRAFRTCRHTLVERRVKGRPRWFLSRPAADLHEEARQVAERMDSLTPHKSGRRGAVYIEGDLVVKSRTAAAARRLFRASYWLTFAGVPCPEPVGLRVHLGRGVVAVRRLPWPNLAEELRNHSLSPANLTAAARCLGEAIGRLHAHGLRARDLKLENLIRNPEDNRVALVDLDGVRRKTALDRRGQGADLGRLLAAFHAARIEDGKRIIGAFLRGYNAARKCLLVPRNAKSDRYLRRLSEVRAAAWASAHRNAPGCSGDSSAG
jgi:tRNA A-37 threonylcarbamoyl transferase component Bud32